MITKIYVDSFKIYRLFIPAWIFFLAVLFFSIYFYLHAVLHDFSFFKAVGVSVYFYVMFKWAEELLFFFQVAMQKEPIIQIQDDGLIFNYAQRYTYIPWDHVIKVDFKPSLTGIMMFLTADAEVKHQSPFAKLGPNVIVMLRYMNKPQEEVFALLMTHEYKFYQDNE
ncbi:MAG: hypothetical protein WC747_01990 [Candidatus Babeliales bacterium]|jgi:hypothetical protein